MRKLLIFFVTYLIVFNSYAQSDDKIAFSLFMVGHAGNFDASDSRQVNLFQNILDYNKNKKGLVFLGDNVYPGLSDILSENFDELVNDSQFEPLRKFNGPIAFIPGWTDWAYGSSVGKDMVKWEYKTIHKQFPEKEIYMPDWGCPGPVEVNINDSLTLVLLDTQWWLHPYDTRFGKCDLEDENDVWMSLQDVLRRNRNKQVVVAGFYPVISYGEYGGHYSTAKEILTFPVTAYRKYLGTRLDLAHPNYKVFSEKLRSILEEFPDVIYASSHEQNFQYFNKNEVHYVIGGSLNGGRYVDTEKLVCGSKDAGYSRLDFYNDGRVELLFFSLDDLTHPACKELLYEYQKQEETVIHTEANPVFPDSIVHPASLQYNTSTSGNTWMGQNYRDVWSTPVNVSVFDIAKEHGGLEIIKRGGGQQTHSLRLEAPNEHQYALRSLEKFVEGALPDEVHNTLAVDVVQDNISASNPYAALPVASLAEFAGVNHTNPKVVYVPNDNRLDEYKEDLAGSLFLFEERPSGNWSHQASFGFSSDIVGTDDVLEEIEEDPDQQVDQQSVLKARLFDTFINDWDRHDDQWRWASYKNGKHTIYQPIPRDRDQAFYVNEGILPWITARKWLMPKIQGFDSITPNMNGLTFNARYFDRTFLTEPDWQDWKQTIDTLQNLLTDEKIQAAMNAFPKEVRPLVADKTAAILKARRDNLELMARQHYLALAEKVNIVGTDEEDLFEVTRLNDHQTEVSVFEISKKHQVKQQYYHRIFKTDETKEIRLYGLQNDDLFQINGAVDKGPIVRVIGGKGKDSIQNKSRVKAPGKQTFVYDRKKNTHLEVNRDTRNHLSQNKRINHYDRMDFKYDVVTPGIFTGYNPDDGLFVGGGPTFYKDRFRRHTTKTIMANFATRTNAFNIKYLFDSESEVNGFDHHFSFEMKAPDYAMNYFGLGNESHKNDLFDDDYYRLSVNQQIAEYRLGHRFGKTAFKQSKDGSINESELLLGVFWKRSNIEEEEDRNRFIADLNNNDLSQTDLNRQVFTGLYLAYSYANLDQKVNARRGFEFSLNGRQYFQLNDEQKQFFKLNADIRAYLSFTKDPRTVLAFRLGGSTVFGDYTFLEAAQLGGKTNLRGYLANRFYGDQSIYQNTELRYKLVDFSSYLVNGELGVLGFYDSGRVWLADDDSDKWHHGYGTGFWLSPFEMTIFTATYNWSEEDDMIQVSLNFKF